MSETSSINGVIVIDKPAGLTSARVVDRVKRLLPRGTKVGHAGTLDPFATGVLVVLVGKATKLCEAMMDQPKAYDATLKLGATTATDDLESPEQITPNAKVPTERRSTRRWRTSAARSCSARPRTARSRSRAGARTTWRGAATRWRSSRAP